jgi:hypothetical protein
VVRQWPAKPRTPVRFRSPPLAPLQWAEHRAVSSGGERFLDTEEVRGSNPLPPTSIYSDRHECGPFTASARSARDVNVEASGAARASLHDLTIAASSGFARGNGSRLGSADGAHDPHPQDVARSQSAKGRRYGPRDGSRARPHGRRVTPIAKPYGTGGRRRSVGVRDRVSRSRVAPARSPPTAPRRRPRSARPPSVAASRDPHRR